MIVGKKKIIYFAAALFNGRETLFNSLITERLEKLGYEVILPQRDGFEFGRLAEALSEKLPSKEISSAVQKIIYLLDMGIFIPKSDVVLTVLDEPLDEGMVVEISYAKMMNKLVVGIRTDVRSPYGSISDPLGGIHFFPAYQCDIFIPFYMPCKTPEEREGQIAELLEKIDQAIRRAKKESYYPDNLITEYARLLFHHLTGEINLAESIEKIVYRYLKNKEKLKEIGPKIL